jgi:hypothetical protein
MIHAAVTSACSGVRTFTAELGLSGSAEGRSLRGRLIAGFERPGSMRLEGVAPFGPPAFILVARGAGATLYFPRENRVLQGVRADEILGAMTGIAVTPEDLQAILTGCVVAEPRPTGGRLHQNGWASIDLAGGGAIYLQPDETGWRLRAARVPGWRIEYPSWQNTFPGSVRLMSERAGLDVDLRASLSQLETNVDLPAAAFTVDVPASAAGLTLADLRAAGPLR